MTGCSLPVHRHGARYVTHTLSLSVSIYMYVYTSRLLHVRRSAPVALDYIRFSPARFTPSIEAFPFMYICIFRTIYGTTRVRR